MAAEGCIVCAGPVERSDRRSCDRCLAHRNAGARRRRGTIAGRSHLRIERYARRERLRKLRLCLVCAGRRDRRDRLCCKNCRATAARADIARRKKQTLERAGDLLVLD